MAFRLIPPGEFEMGSRGYGRGDPWNSWSEPRHRVRITRPFWLGETPVTQEQFDIWKCAEKVEHEHSFEGQAKNPAENVSWRDAIAYCSWLTKTKRKQLPRGFPLACLPTEAEWEYACRAGADTAFCTGDGEDDLADAGWFSGNSQETTHQTRQKSANNFGLHDMHGNVWEWCHDEWDEEAYRKREDRVRDPGLHERLEEWRAGLPTMLESRLNRVQRGGCWFNRAAFCCSAMRYRRTPVVRDWIPGFRVCLARGPAAGRGAPRTARVEAEP
ncbi:MAG: formylglycine-generating enzyme family protein [Acidobacteria bacterium]|nr:formylglycine-generating enzyme family protein [Acidobacteriota bacterium]